MDAVIQLEIEEPIKKAIEISLEPLFKRIEEISNEVNAIRGFMKKEYISIDEACKMTGVSKSKFQDLVKEGKLKPIKLGERAVRYKKSDIYEYMERCKSECKN